MDNMQLCTEIIIYFPTMLLFEILLLLPVRSLLRFRCVCKEWCDLIDSRLFKDTYLAIRRAIDVDDQIVGLEGFCIEIPSVGLSPRFSDEDDPFVDEVGLSPRFSDEDDPFVDEVRPVTNVKYSMTCWYHDYKSLVRSDSADNYQLPGNYTDGIRIVGHVNGVVCFIPRDTELSTRQVNRARLVDEEYWSDIKLVNPALREIRKLPNPMFDLLGFCDEIGLGVGGGLMYYRTIRTGFGYDDVNDDYKVVLIVTLFEDDSLYKSIGMVYYLSTNSWKILGDMLWPIIYLKSQESVFSHGSIHWCIGWLSDTDESMLDNRILVFDVSDELFREMSFPHHGWRSVSIYDDDSMIPHLFMLDKSTIALVNSTESGGDVRRFEVWVMNDYGDHDSWTKQISVDEFFDVAFVWKKDTLVLSTQDSDLISYDLSKGQRDLVESGFEIGRWEFVTGHESFFSVKQV